MTYEKLVNYTESPTRYTKIINEGLQYGSRYEVVDYVSRYTKTATGGKGYVPPAPPFDPLAVAEGQDANWVSTNVYEVGETIEAKTAEFTGGLEPVTYRYRFQIKAEGSSNWDNQPWTNTTNAKNSATFTLTEPCQIIFQSQARDSQDPVTQSNSTTGIKNVIDPKIEITEATIVPSDTYSTWEVGQADLPEANIINATYNGGLPVTSDMSFTISTRNSENMLRGVLQSATVEGFDMRGYVYISNRNAEIGKPYQYDVTIGGDNFLNTFTVPGYMTRRFPIMGPPLTFGGCCYWTGTNNSSSAEDVNKGWKPNGPNCYFDLERGDNDQGWLRWPKGALVDMNFVRRGGAAPQATIVVYTSTTPMLEDGDLGTERATVICNNDLFPLSIQLEPEEQYMRFQTMTSSMIRMHWMGKSCNDGTVNGAPIGNLDCPDGTIQRQIQEWIAENPDDWEAIIEEGNFNSFVSNPNQFTN